jgi:hypothetical protein
VRRVAIVLGVAVLLVAGWWVGRELLPGQPVFLLTGVSPTTCYAGGESSSGISGVLRPDPSFGTVIGTTPIMWPVGYTARRVGSEVEVLDMEGRVKATTGRSYRMSIAPLNNFPVAPSFNPAPPSKYFPAAANCGYPWDFTDCTAAATATGEPISSDGRFTAVGEGFLDCGLRGFPLSCGAGEIIVAPSPPTENLTCGPKRAAHTPQPTK